MHRAPVNRRVLMVADVLSIKRVLKVFESIQNEGFICYQVGFMGTVLRYLCLILVTTRGFGQRPLEIEFTNTDAELVGTTYTLQFFHCSLQSVALAGQPPFLEGNMGTVTFTTPIFRVGDTTRGGR